MNLVESEILCTAIHGCGAEILYDRASCELFNPNFERGRGNGFFDTIGAGTLRGRIAEKIRQAILTGSLKEGQRLIERDLATQFAISLTVIREALIDFGKGRIRLCPGVSPVGRLFRNQAGFSR